MRWTRASIKNSWRAVSLYGLCTETGEFLLIEVPSPSCPEELSPQHQIVLSVSSPQVWAPPALMLLAVVIPGTWTGLVEVVLGLVLTPSCP